jgi:aryl-alcohol dehydrogenase-like predicted oxidoreductase
LITRTNGICIEAFCNSAIGPVIVSNSNVKQLKDNAQAGKITLSAEQIAEIEDII